MRWPWVSRRAYELLAEMLERERLRVDQLTDALIRLERKAAGLPERVPPTRPKREPEPMPSPLYDQIQGFANPSIRDFLMDQAFKERGRGRPWPEPVKRTTDGTTDDDEAAAPGNETDR